MNNETKTKVLKVLSQQLGIEPEDIKDEDSLEADLHMRPSDLSDFIENLGSLGIDTQKLDLTQVETVIDLIYGLEGETYSE